MRDTYEFSGRSRLFDGAGDRLEKSRAEGADRRGRLEVERLVELYPIILVEKDPAGGIQAGATTLYLADGEGQPVSSGHLRGYRKEKHNAWRSERANDDTGRPCLATRLFSLRRLAAPQIDKPDDLPRLKHCLSR